MTSSTSYLAIAPRGCRAMGGKITDGRPLEGHVRRPTRLHLNGFGRPPPICAGLVPGAGFEPATFGLQNRCTTTVLTRQAMQRRAY